MIKDGNQELKGPRVKYEKQEMKGHWPKSSNNQGQSVHKCGHATLTDNSTRANLPGKKERGYIRGDRLCLTRPMRSKTETAVRGRNAPPLHPVRGTRTCTVQTPGLLAGAGSPAGLVGRLGCVTVCVMCACGCRGHGQGLEKLKGMRKGGTVAAAATVSWAGAPA